MKNGTSNKNTLQNKLNAIKNYLPVAQRTVRFRPEQIDAEKKRKK